jgi:hypothetical protein
MKLYHNNMRYLQKSSPALYQIITSSQPVYKAETKPLPDIHNALIRTSSGECYIHSLYHREREMERLFAGANRDARIVALFGLGMGDAIPYIRQYFPLLEYLVVIEPNCDVFQQLLHSVNFAEVFQDFRELSIILNQTEAVTSSVLNKLLQEKLFRQVECIAPLSYRTLYRDYYSATYETIISAVRRMWGNLATKRFSSNKWLSNEWRNQGQADIRLETLLTRLPALPVILVSAGPSLNRNISLLPDAKKKAIIIAVGSAMTILESHGITPHFRMALDGNESCQAVFNAVDTRRCPLIYSNMLYHGVLPRYEGKKIEMVLASNWLTRYLRDKQAVDSMIINVGHSIATSAFDLACRWGTKVILMGQDFCYTRERLHADGAWDDDAPSRVVDKNVMVRTQDLDGQPVYTDQALLNMKAAFEETRLSYSLVDCINATEGGLPVKGIRNESLRQVLDALPDVPEITAMIEKAMETATSMADETCEAIEVAAGELAEIMDINQARMALISNLQSLEGQTIAVDWFFQQLEKIEALSQKLHSIGYYTKVLYPFLADIFYANRLRLEYSDDDKAAKAKAMIQSYAGETAELQKLVDFNYRLLLECDRRMPYSIWREMM